MTNLEEIYRNLLSGQDNQCHRYHASNHYELMLTSHLPIYNKTTQETQTQCKANDDDCQTLKPTQICLKL